MKRFYVEFKTWAEGKITIPWPYVIFQETDDYRHRHDLSLHVHQKTLQSVFMSFNNEIIDKFFEKHVNAVIIGSIIPAESSDLLMPLLKKAYGYCEILGQCEINSSNEQKIMSVMADAKHD